VPGQELPPIVDEDEDEDDDEEGEGCWRSSAAPTFAFGTS
jgi:hypothetical protein